MLTPWLVLTLSLGVPFVDAEKRFNLDLPGCWEVGPLPGGASGVSFRCTMGDKVALAAVRIFPGAGNSSAAQFARQLASALEKEPGFTLVEEGSVELAGRPSARRRYIVYVDKDPEMVKMAEDQVVMSKGTAFVVHVESLRPTFFAFQRDFERIYATFRLGAEPAVAEYERVSITGKWLMKGTPDTYLELNDDGSYDLAGTRGTYRVEGKALLMWMPGAGMERFAWRLDRSELVLSSPNLDEPIRYEKTAGALIGHWQGGGRALHLQAKGKAELDGKAVTYKVTDDRLILKVGGKRKVVRYVLSNDELVVSGGGFGKKTKLKRK